MNVKLILSIFLFSFCLNSFAVKKDETPLLFQAVLKEDKELYSKEMERLLKKGTMEDFRKTIQFETKNGNNIFHLIAGVQTHQEFFAKEMESLNDVFDSGSFSDKQTLGGLEISIPYLEDTKIFQAIEKVNVTAILSELNHLKEKPAIEWIQIIHARTEKDGKDLGWVFQNLKEARRGFFGKIIEDETIHNRKLTNLWNSRIKRTASLSSNLLNKRNNQGQYPKNVAFQSGNLAAYKYTSAEDPVDFILIGTGMILGVISGAATPQWLGAEHPLIFLASFLGGGVAGGLGPLACKQLFMEKKIKKKAIKNQTASQTI